jgi:hypothetical protein
MHIDIVLHCIDDSLCIGSTSGTAGPHKVVYGYDLIRYPVGNIATR